MTRYFVSSLLLLSLYSCKSLDYKTIHSQKKCDSKKNSTWYNGICWRNFEDESISLTDIDSIVSQQLLLAEQATLKIGNQAFPLTAFIPLPEGKKTFIIAEYTDSTGAKSLITALDEKETKQKKGEKPHVILNGSVMRETFDTVPYARGIIHYNLKDENQMQFSGYFIENQSKDSLVFSFEGNEAVSGLGNSELIIEGDHAFLSGDLGTKTYSQIKEMIEKHPEVKTLILTTISGSINDAVNMHTGRIVREAGLTTKVLSTSSIASGGVDLFCAGKNRIVEKGAKIGVHSWCCVNDLTAIELPKNHPGHKAQLEYFTLVLGPIDGPEFYFYTLNAASFNGVHWMSEEEIIKYKVVTEFNN